MSLFNFTRVNGVRGTSLVAKFLTSHSTSPVPQVSRLTAPQRCVGHHLENSRRLSFSKVSVLHSFSDNETPLASHNRRTVIPVSKTFAPQWRDFSTTQISEKPSPWVYDKNRRPGHTPTFDLDEELISILMRRNKTGGQVLSEGLQASYMTLPDAVKRQLEKLAEEKGFTFKPDSFSTLEKLGVQPNLWKFVQRVKEKCEKNKGKVWTNVEFKQKKQAPGTNKKPDFSAFFDSKFVVFVGEVKSKYTNKSKRFEKLIDEAEAQIRSLLVQLGHMAMPSDEMDIPIFVVVGSRANFGVIEKSGRKWEVRFPEEAFCICEEPGILTFAYVAMVDQIRRIVEAYRSFDEVDHNVNESAT